MPDNEQPSLRDTIESSIAEHVPTDPVEQAVPAPAAAASESADEPKPGRTAGRARDEQGRLLPGAAAKTDAAPAAPAAANAPSQEVVAPQAAAPIPRPSSWAKEMWPLWDKLNTGAPLTAAEARQVAEYNAKRETQFATGVSTYKQLADSAKPLMEAIAPFQADLDRHGIPAPQMVHRLMDAHRTLALGSPQQKLQMLTRVIGEYGIPIQALYDQNAQQQYLASAPAQQQQPAAQPQPDYRAAVREELANIKINETIESMAANTQKYPFFHYVRPKMAQLLESGEATDLDHAYQLALEAPEHAMLSTVQASQQAQQTEAQRVATAQAAARVARANTVSTRSATPANANPVNGKRTVREDLKDAMELHRGGARV